MEYAVYGLRGGEVGVTTKVTIGGKDFRNNYDKVVMKGKGK